MGPESNIDRKSQRIQIRVTKAPLKHCGLVTPYIAIEIWVNIGSGNELFPDGTNYQSITWNNVD